MQTGNTVERATPTFEFRKLHCMDQATTSVGGKSVSQAFGAVQSIQSCRALIHTTEATEMILEGVSADLTSVAVMLRGYLFPFQHSLITRVALLALSLFPKHILTCQCPYSTCCFIQLSKYQYWSP